MPFLLRKHWTVAILCLVLVLAGVMRLFDVNFDQGTHQHPDERFITQVALDRVNVPPGVTLAQLLDPLRSPLNPRINGQDFHYGALPLYLVKGIATVGGKLFTHPEWVSYDDLPLVGRTTAALFDLVTVLLVFLIARRLYGKGAGLLAAIFSAFAVIQIQIAHFYIAEPFLVTFLTAALYFSVVLMQTRRAWAAALAGLMLGFALACKVSVVAVAVLIITAVALRVVYRARTRQLGPPADLDDPYGLEPAGRAERTSSTAAAARGAFGLLLLAGVMTLLGFAIGDPFGVFDSGLMVNLNANTAFNGTVFFQMGPLQLVALTGKYLAQLGNEAAIQRGTADVPYTIQFVGTTPVLYNVQQLVQWGMGPASGVVAICGLLLAVWLAIRRRAAEILLLSGLVPYFLTIVTLEAKWPRYLLPIVPYLCILAGALLARGLQWSAVAAPRMAAWRARRRTWPLGLALRRWCFPAITGVAVLGSLLWAVAFMNIYTHEHSRVVASHWITRNLAPATAIGHETWDDSLPLGMPGDPNGGWRGVDMGLYDFNPGPAEFTYLTGLLSQVDYIIPSSNRLYSSIPHEPWRFPVQIKYYQLLMSGKLGFEQVLPAQDQKIYPEIFGIKINDDGVDESFTVYDHPHVLVFKKVRNLSTDELRTLFGSAVDRPAINIRHLEVHTAADYDKSLELAQPPGQQLALDDYAWNPLAQNGWVALLLWLLAVEVLGLLAWPLTALVCRRLPDRGYPLSKILALVLVTWLVWMLASLRLVPFTVYSILGAIGVLALASALIWRRFGPELRPWLAAHRRLILGWEALFGVAFAAFLVIRILDPDLWQPWQGGEKPMEFGFLNSILRSPWMPPGDPFFSGGYINYYYYGWAILGVLIKLLGIPPAIGFNLSIPLLFALSVLGGGSLVYNCVATVQRARGWRVAVSWTAFGWAAVGAVLLAAIGNLTFLLQFISMKLPSLQTVFVHFMANFGPVSGDISRTYPGFDYWGGATRVIPFTINEWPFWTFLFADLHPHLIDISFSLLALGLILNLVLGAWRWPVFAPLSAAFTEADVPPVPAPGVLARPADSPFWRATLEAGQRLWGSSPLDGLLRFAVTALAIGTLYAVNSWDFPVSLLVVLAGLLVAVLIACQAYTARRAAIRLATAAAAVIGLGLVAVMGLVFYAPFLATFKPFYNQIKFITAGMPRSGLAEFLAVWGLFIFIGFSYLGLHLWKYPWAATFRGLRDLIGGGQPRLAPAPALAAAGPVAASGAGLDLGMSRFMRAAEPAAELAPVLAGAGSAAPVGNGHIEAAAVPAALVVPAPPREEWEEYGLGDVGALGLELDAADLLRQRRTHTAVIDDSGYRGTNSYGEGPGEPAVNGHDAEVADYDFIDVRPSQRSSLPAEVHALEATVPVDQEGAPIDGGLVAEAPATDLAGDDVSPNGAVEAAVLGNSIEIVAAVPAPAASAAAIRTPPRGLLWPAAGVGLLVVTAALSVAMFLGHEWLRGVLIFLVGGLIATHVGSVRNPGHLFGGLLLAVGWGIALGVEYVYLADHLAGDTQGYYRMNTVFKFYEQVWILVACGSAVALYTLIGPRGRGTVRATALPPGASLADAPLAPAGAALAPIATTTTAVDSPPETFMAPASTVDEVAPAVEAATSADSTATAAPVETTFAPAETLRAVAPADTPPLATPEAESMPATLLAETPAAPEAESMATVAQVEPPATAEAESAPAVAQMEPAAALAVERVPAEAQVEPLAAPEAESLPAVTQVELLATPDAESAPAVVLAELAAAGEIAPDAVLTGVGSTAVAVEPIETPSTADAGLADPASETLVRPLRRVLAGSELVDALAVAQAPAQAMTTPISPAGEARLEAVQQTPRTASWFSPARAIWMLPLLLLLLGSLIFTVSGTQARVADRMPGDQPPVGTLNGMDWMNKTVLTLEPGGPGLAGPVNFRFEREALDWVNANVKGTPVFAAAPFGYYRESGMMISTYTGVPMVVGGLHQEEQRYDWQVSERRGDMTNFYTSPDISQALLLIDKYDIQYIYVGQIETFGYQKDPQGLAKFPQMVGKYLEVAHKNDLVTIYHVLVKPVLADIGTAPGAAPRPTSTPAPKPTEPPLGDDPVLRGLLAGVQSAPSSLDARRALAEYYRAHSAVQKAIEQYVVVAQLAPQDVPAHQILGDLYTQNGEPDKALAAWEDATKQAGDADKPSAFNKVGIAYAERQRFDDAINAFKQAVAADSGYAEGWFHLGDTYQTMQNVDAARSAFQTCIKNARPDESGQNWAKEAQKRLDNLK